MPSLKEVRIRIASVKSTRQITSAMKMVSASKLRKGQTIILSLRPYAEELNKLMLHLYPYLEQSEAVKYSKAKPNNKCLLIVIASNKGLCGAYNANIIKKSHLHIHELKQQGKEVSLVLIGKKVIEHFSKFDNPIFESNIHINENPEVKALEDYAERLMDLFTSGVYEKIELVYNRFKNAASQEVVVEHFLPFENPQHSKTAEGGSDVYIFEPNKAQIIEELVPRTLKTQFAKIIMDAYASEQGARMTSMHKATENATQLLKDLTISYNKARQATITREIVEIVSGAEALKS